MTAGGGILHIERPPEEMVAAGGLFHGIQLWVNLPATQKWVEPRYQDIRAGQVTLVRSPDGGAMVRVIAGEVAGHPGRAITYTPIAMAHATVSPGARLELPWDPSFNALAYVLAGQGTVGAERRPVRTGQLAVFGGDGDTLVVTADEHQDSRTPSLEVLILGGRPIGEPVAAYGPFVMNNRAELAAGLRRLPGGPHGDHPGRRALSASP